MPPLSRIFRTLLVPIFWAASCLIASAQAPNGLAARPSFAAFNGAQLPPDAEPTSGAFSTVVAFPKLTFQDPMGVLPLPLPGSTKLVVWSREGYIWSFDNDPDVSTKKLILDLHEVCQGWDDEGLLGLAFHPNFATNHYLYVWYNRPVAGEVVIGNANVRPPDRKQTQRLARFTYSPTTGLIDRNSEYVIIDQTEFSALHNGGGMFFHPDDGFLYLSNGNDTEEGTDQTISGGFFGGVIRIDVDKRGGSISHAPLRRAVGEVGAHWPNAYYVPNDNPFVGQPGVLEEYFALGLRNPHRMTIDPVSKRIFIGDVGGSAFEEINTIEPGESGLNFQYNLIEGYNGDLTPPYIGINRRPYLAYPHTGFGNAVIGGYVYRGTELPFLVGKYIFGDNATGAIYLMDESTHTDTTPASMIQLAILPLGPGPSSGVNYCGLSSFGLDQNNELLLCQMSSVGGQIYKLSSTGPLTHQMPATLSATGVFADLASLTPSPGFLSYDVNTLLWSDGAQKKRWFAVPDGQTIDFTPTDSWTFPTGSVFIKHFELPTDDRDPTVTQRLETRVLVRDDLGQVYGGSYKWRPDYSDADLVVDQTTQDVTITNADGTTRTQSWFYPGRQDCTICHNKASSGVLGINTRQSNRNHLFPETGNTDNQIHAWSHAGYFTAPPADDSISSLSKLSAIDDTTASIEQRARSYLDANCAQCHRPGGAPAFWDARSETPLDQANIVNGFVQDNLGINGAHVITPGNPATSILYQRLNTASATYIMPPLARNVIDQPAVDVLAQWIAEVTPPPLPPLPAGWQDGDFGDVGVAGTAGFSMGGVFTLEGAGVDIAGGSDSFHFTWHAMEGNGSLAARVLAVTQTSLAAKAGVLIRDSLDPDAAEAMTVMTPALGVFFQWRTRPGAPMQLVDDTTTAPPAWVKIERQGDVFISSDSPDGVNYTELGRQTIKMGHTVQIGMGVTSCDTAQLAGGSFDQLDFTGVGPVVDPPPAAIVSGKFSWTLSGSVLSVTGLPAGLRWDARAGTITGTPSIAGTYPVVVTGRTAQGVITETLDLTVNPIPVGLTGGFAGMIDHNDAVTGGLGGWLKFQVAKSGLVAGNLMTSSRGAAYPWQGRLITSLNGDPTLASTIPHAGLGLALTLHSADASFDGTLTRGTDSALVSGRHFLSAAAAVAGTYQASVNVTGADLGDPTKPQGQGSLRLKLSDSGAITLAGHLGDGTPVLFGSHLLDDLSFPFFLRLYSGHGSISGTPAFSDGNTLSGTLDWRKLSPVSRSDPFPSFTATPELTGAAAGSQ